MLETMPERLTARTKAGGCASKLSPKIVEQVLARLPRQIDPNVLVGFDTADDAGVYRLAPDCALVQTVDFFTPIVDDPWTFGAIAAANALSDVYAMGGRPLSSLTILCWPAQGAIDELEAILRGGAAVMKEAGCVILGGHSVNDEEVKFGYAVTGTISPERVLTNAGALPGDALLFTKRIGTGVITTALKRGTARADHVAAAVEQMRTLNNAACEAMLRFDTHGCTDVTGFGLLGHAREWRWPAGSPWRLNTPPFRCSPAPSSMRAEGPSPEVWSTTASSSPRASRATSPIRCCSTRKPRAVCSSRSTPATPTRSRAPVRRRSASAASSRRGQSHYA